VWQCVLYVEFICFNFRIFNCMLLSIDKKSKNVACKYFITLHWQNIRERSATSPRNLENLSVNFLWNLACFQTAPLKFCVFFHQFSWSLIMSSLSGVRLSDLRPPMLIMSWAVNPLHLVCMFVGISLPLRLDITRKHMTQTKKCRKTCILDFVKKCKNVTVIMWEVLCLKTTLNQICCLLCNY